MLCVGGLCQGNGIFLSHNGVSPCMADLKRSGFRRIVIAGHGNFHAAFIAKEQCVGCRVIWTGQHDRNIRQGAERSSIDGKRKRKTAVRIRLDDDFNLIFVLDALRQGVPEIRSVVSSENSEKSGLLESASSSVSPFACSDGKSSLSISMESFFPSQDGSEDLWDGS